MIPFDPSKMQFSELMRPRTLNDFFATEPVIAGFKHMIESGQIMSMIFSGPPGVGKTSMARTICESVGADALTLVGSSLTPKMREEMLSFVHTASLLGPKVCVIEEAEFVPRALQASWRSLIEDTAGNCRFLFTTNAIHKIDDALRSRMLHIDFSIERADKPKIIRHLMERYQAVLTEMHVPYNVALLRTIITDFFPDLRAIANQVEFEFVRQRSTPTA